MDIDNKKFLVFGAGISGIGSCRLLLMNNADTVLYDSNINKDKSEILNKLPESNNFKLILGELTDEIINETDILVLSPGVPTDNEDVLKFKKAGAVVWGEVELAFAFEKGKVMAITGTNGKTTTTSLLGEIMKKYNEKTFVAGNIGIAYTKTVMDTDKDSISVLENSSFQLETIENYHPVVSAILNLTPDHLDRHHTFENYINAKKNITKNQTEADFCILNYEDENVRKIADEIKASVIFFSSKRKLDKGLYTSHDSIIYNDGNKENEICKFDELNILGTHNHENVMAACGMAIAINVPLDVISEVVKSFKAVEHRIEFCGKKNGVYFYNDSKGTNPDAAIKGINAMSRKTCLIGGGYDKNSSYDEWIESFNGKVKLLVLIGQTREKIAQCAKEHGFTDYVFADSLEEAVKICVENAKEDEAVLLSPACASWGMFTNYEERGRLFKELVSKL
ncbi:UDP-N-acetylmuramoylalanine--D-glutamate ligase [Acetitomaculum ruminis DSM 5522]|uniref:UDP-N-acetylmuramoylalanine--D-glutamate ligase n=1 Tax=Acetitomaculum ruminis DSM 5522 TaxID=1120918 RepID=A0A1I0VUS2_9FIRM|nr:UDP-N-acetylmuramoyl-L-alanine--D-glutamate ligase [Acetitomaculum ruminis]SFA80155.1 UDP-N-acetylmuramoylalanine--D-glutamate ligase [Acetitomaculum ruminis DSM 5522]